MQNICENCRKEILGKSYGPGMVEIIRTICSSCERKSNPAYKYETEGRLLKDGIYDMTDVQVIYFRDINWYEPDKLEEQVSVKEFMEEHPDYVVAQAYQANTIYVISSAPPNIGATVHKFGDGFNYGSCNFLTQLPYSILILAEDD